LDCEFADGTVIGVMPEYVLQLTGRTLQQHIETATGYYWIKLVACILAILLVEKCYCFVVYCLISLLTILQLYLLPCHCRRDVLVNHRPITL